MRNLSKRAGVFAATSVVLAASVAGNASAATAEDAVSRVIEQYVQARADDVTNAPAARSAGAAMTAGFKVQAAVEAREGQAFRQRWAGSLWEYGKAVVTMGKPVVQKHGTGATVKIEERTDLYFARRASASMPEKTSYRVDHVIELTGAAGTWEIASDTLDLPIGSVNPLPYFTTARTGGPGERQVTTAAKTEAAQVNSVAGAPYNRQAMADYAKRWALDRNSAYPSFGNDCTNFVSQAMSAGGWLHVVNPGPFGNPTDKGNWYMRYLSTHAGYSQTWSVADMFRYFAIDNSTPRRVTLNGNHSRRGDVIWADWDLANGSPGVDGHWDHVMIITGDAYPNVDDWITKTVSYHTTDTRDVPLQQVWEKSMKRSPNFGFYFGYLIDAP
ncbi:amidase domain-containing protein [Amycolatopsis sp. cg5]|uniref:amidase domain-containing protein n=1 Tax=Amycolatopsis sp. cg5 TaxID=3238802 RepID=UPI003526AFFA